MYIPGPQVSAARTKSKDAAVVSSAAAARARASRRIQGGEGESYTSSYAGIKHNTG